MRYFRLSLVVLLPLVLSERVGAQSRPEVEARAQIEAAVSGITARKPERPRRLLVFSLTRDYRHGSIPIAVSALSFLGEKTGAYRAVASEDIDAFEPGSLAGFDAICLLSTTGELFRPTNFKELSEAEQRAALEREARLKKGLLEFVRGGRGLVGIHAATDCFYEWPEYGEIIGGYFDGHPWNEQVFIKVNKPDTPLTAMFDSKAGFALGDEIYQMRAPYDAGRCTELLSLDVSRTDMSKPEIKRGDGDFPVSWVRQEGRGRVFYCSLGHREEIYWNTKVLGHYLAGIQYALGDLAIDAAATQFASGNWKALFDGQTLTGWTCKPGTWVVEDGALSRKGGGNIWTTEAFGDFEFEAQFKLAKETNSGIFFRTADIRDEVQTSIELQILDSAGKPLADKHDCGAIYDIQAPRTNAVRAAGEWNDVRLTCRGSRIQAVLNGALIIDLNLDDWTQAGRNPDGSANKFKTAYQDMPRSGKIGFQDHGKPVWFRNIRIRSL